MTATLQYTKPETDLSKLDGQQDGLGEKVPLPLLADVNTYQAHTFEYIPNRNEEGLPALQDWVEVFRNSRPQFHKMAMEDEAVPEEERQAAADRFLDTYEEVLKGIEANPTKPLPGFEPATVNCVSLSAMRDRCLRNAGFADCFKEVKGAETNLALAFLPSLLKEIDGIEDQQKRMETVIRGVIAGNIFDLGAAIGADLYNSGQMPKFQETRNTLQERPWAEDDLDTAVAALTGANNPPFKKAVLFCDNAGSDIVLGMIPLARELVRTGTVCVIAANEQAAINDVTAAELKEWLAAAGKKDQVIQNALDEGTLSVASTGTNNCVIDLSGVSPSMAKIAEDCDLVVLEGMGRAIETNLRAKFKVAALKVGMIKHQEVAMELKAKMFGCVCRFDPAPSK